MASQKGSRMASIEEDKQNDVIHEDLEEDYEDSNSNEQIKELESDNSVSVQMEEDVALKREQGK